MRHFLAKLFCNYKAWALLLLSGLAGQMPALGQAASCGSIDPAGNSAQAGGLYAEYYAGYWYGSATTDTARSAFFTANKPAIRRVETSSAINFPNNDSWGDLTQGGVGPASGSPANPNVFSARYRGEINLPTTDTYTFYLSSDDAGYLWIDDGARPQNLVLGGADIQITSSGIGVASAGMTLAAGYHDIALLYGEDQVNNYLVLKYTSSTVTTPTVVPSSWFCTGIRSVPTALAYSPAAQQTPYMTSSSSPAPTVADGNSPVTAYLIANADSLPAGITINSATGVLTAAATVLPGAYLVSVSATNSSGTATFAGAYTFAVVAPGCGGIDPYGNPSQPGLQAEYYAGYFSESTGFFVNNAAYPLGSFHNKARIQRVEGALNYTSDGAWRASGLNLFTAGVAGGSDAAPNDFSARYRGKLYISVAGDYTFSVRSDDGAYLVIDGSAAAQAMSAPYTVNNGLGHGPTTVTSAATTLAVGWHDLELLYGNGPTESYLSLQYSGPGIAMQVIPTAVLCTGIVSVPTGIIYVPDNQTYVVGTRNVSAVPTVYNGNIDPVTYAIANAGSLPAGITIDANTGVLTADTAVVAGNYVININAINAAGTALFPRVYTFNILLENCRDTDAGGSPPQAGLYGEYYSGYFGDATGSDSDANLAFFTNTTPKMQGVASALNFTASSAWSDSGLNLFTAGVAATSDAQPTLFSARYRGRIYIETDGDYTFYLTSDDASYLFLDAAARASTLTIASATVNNGNLHGPGVTKSGTKYLAAGFHELQVLYGQSTADSYLKLEYAGPAGNGIPQQVVSSAALCSTSSNQPLPVTLTHFAATAVGPTVAVRWATASERNSAWFEVERSADALTFSKIGQVAATGTTSQKQQYQLPDRAPLAGVSYYRLRQVDLDGTAHYSAAVPVQPATATLAPTLTLAPNPTAGRVTVQLVQATAQAAVLQVLDALGREVRHQRLPAATVQEQALDLSALPAGVYLVRVVSAAGVATQRLVRQ